MSMIKKLIALTLALAMVLSVSAFAGNYSVDTYADAAQIDEDCEAAIELLYALDIMTGDDKGNFNPTATIKRAEIVKMIYVILNYGEDDKAVTYTGGKFFSDVADGAWYEGYVNYAAATKLVQGRPDGTFGPEDPVTTAEAAKMLLTAIGYSAEARGYTGANWDKNVLSDAAILGLLEGYKSNVNTYAPRQWVAVMFANALEAKTFDTMYPTFNGLLTSGSSVNYPTMMGKYLGAEVVKGIMTSANGYIIDGDKVAGSGKVVVGGEEFEADATIEDLGQEFKAIVVGGEAISMRNTGKSVVAEDEVKDVTYELAYATSANKADNKYVFTVGDLSGKLDSVKVISKTESVAVANVLNVVAGNDEYEQLDASKLKAEIAKGAYRNDVVRAIDANADGDIEYVIYTPVEYAVITKVATSQKYGDYVKATAANGTVLTVEGGSNLYIKDCIITEDELEVGDIVKYTWNIDEGMYNVEVLPVAEFVEFDSRKVTKNEYTFDGETYNKAANAFVVKVNDMVDLTASGMLGDDFDIVVDGDLLVHAIKSDDNYKSMDEVNAKLAVLIKADYRNAPNDENDKQVKLLTIDGEQAWYAYDVTGAVEAEDAENDVILKWSDLMDDITINSDVEKDTDWDQLVIVHSNDDGEVYLETIPGASDWETAKPYTDLNLPTELVDSVTDKKAQLKVTETSVKFDGVKLVADNEFFAKIEGEYRVVTAAELAEGTYSGVDAQALVNIGNRYDTVVGGYLIIAKADPTTAAGYLFVLDQEEKQYDDDDRIVYVLLDDGSETEMEISSDVYNDFCYYYAFDGSDYTLTFEWANKGNAEGDTDGILWYGKNNSIDTSDYDTIALKTVVYERSQPDAKWEIVDGADDFVSEDQFITADDLAALVIEICGADETNEYIYTIFDNVTSDSDNKCLFVELAVYMNANQEYSDAE